MLEYEKQKWDNIKKTGDFLDFIEDPKVNIDGWMIHNIDTAKSGFWVAANVNFDFDVKELIEKAPQIAANEVSTVTRLPQEVEHHEKYGFSNGYDRHGINDDLKKIIIELGFEEGNYSSYINNQPPATMIHRHMDYMSCWIREQDVLGSDIRDIVFDKVLKQPAATKPVYRCFVALDDWHPGQIVNFEPDFWSGWKKGDAAFFDWRNTPHTTANSGIENRPFLKITGTIENDSYITESRKSGVVEQRTVR
jgi:hypothetical protein